VLSADALGSASPGALPGSLVWSAYPVWDAHAVRSLSKEGQPHQPPLVILGEQTITIMPTTLDLQRKPSSAGPSTPPAPDSIVAALPDARLVTIPASDPGWEPSAMTRVLAESFADR
jgi:hypothetical protein